MEEIKICSTKEEDIPYIEEKLQKYLLDTTDIEWQQFLVAKSKNKPVAFGRIIDHRDYFEIASLGVDYYHRKKGIGAKMLRFLIGEAKKRDNTRPIYIVTHIPEFFKKFGFEEIPVYPDYLGYKKGKCRSDGSKISIMEYRSLVA